MDEQNRNNQGGPMEHRCGKKRREREGVLCFAIRLCAVSVDDSQKLYLAVQFIVFFL